MIVAVLSDIHGNHFALEQVLKTAKQRAVEKLLVLGDIVGYYYHPDKVLALLDEWDYELIRGNHEVFLVNVQSGELDMAVLKKKYGSGHQLALEKLSTKQLQTLLNAPDQKKLTINGTDILMCHGSSWDPDYYLYPDTDKKILDRTGEANVNFVVVGHSHYPFIHHNEQNILVNVGSVGQSRKKGGLANWMYLDTVDNSFELVNTPYDVKPLIEEIKQIDPETPYLQKILIRNNDV